MKGKTTSVRSVKVFRGGKFVGDGHIVRDADPNKRLVMDQRNTPAKGRRIVGIRGGPNGKAQYYYAPEPRAAAGTGARSCAENTHRKSKFRPGDAVELTIGSYPLIVVSIERDGMLRLVSCRSNYLETQHLPERGLKLWRAPKKKPAASDDAIPF